MFSNRYIQRRVASTDSRACFVCYKPTSSVLVQEDQADFFYACDTHLTDPGFAVLDAASQDAERKRRERQAEIDDLKKEWEQRKPGAKATEKPDASTADADKDTSAAGKNTDAGKAGGVPALPPAPPAAVRKTYELNKGILNLRLGAKKRVAQERRTKALLETPGAFPKVPSHKPQ